jgi:phosphate transport system substrate-binding protein
MRRRHVLWVVAMALGGAACSRGGAKADLKLVGSSSVEPFAKQWAEAYRQGHADVGIQIQGSDSTAGIQAALSGAADIGMSSRELAPDDAGKLVRIVVARDGVTIIVHPSNPLGDAKPDQVRAIFTGETTRWSGVGGADRSIHVVTRESGSGTRATFEDLVLKGKPFSSAVVVQGSQSAVRQAVSTDPDAIGYVSQEAVDGTVKALKIAGVESSPVTVANHTYPLARPFYFLVKGEMSPRVKDFVDWVLGPDGQAVVRKEGLYAVK